MQRVKVFVVVSARHPGVPVTQNQSDSLQHLRIDLSVVSSCSYWGIPMKIVSFRNWWWGLILPSPRLWLLPPPLTGRPRGGSMT